MRTIIIGDVHGCADALEALLDKVHPSRKDTLVLLGDLFDRGPDSWEVFRQVQTLAEIHGERFVLLRGNHEDYLLQEKLTFSQRMIWERVGRSATVRSFRAHGRRMEDAVPWLREHCVLFWQGGGVQCVHAGLKVEPIEANDLRTLVHDHSIVLENKYAGPITVTGHIALEAPTWFAGDGITRKPLPPGEMLALPPRGVICIDSGCGKGGRLTAMVLEEDHFTLASVGQDG